MGQKIRVLVVDDSVVFRTQIKSALERSDRIEVVGSANNGKIALQKLEQLSVDLITLDMEMPEMDGLETIRQMKSRGIRAKVIVFSSQTKRGSEAALNALALGADDFLCKPELSAENQNPGDEIARELVPKVLQFSHEVRPIPTTPSPKTTTTGSSRASRDLSQFRPSVIVIGSSTGGPQTLEKVLSEMPKPLRCPILIAQHMPPVFTASLAKRLESCSGIPCSEGKDMEQISPNRIYVAPGNFHMKVVQLGDSLKISLDQDPPRNSVRPAVDVLFESAARIFRSNCFGMILTGMGEDGLLGCREIKQQGGSVAIQNKDSCVVFGMPGAVYADGCYDQASDPIRLRDLLVKMCSPSGSLS